MTTTTTITCTPDELVAMIRVAVRQEIQERFDKPVSRKEVAQMWGCSIETVKKCEQRGELVRINKDSMRPKYSLNKVMESKRYEKI